MTHELLMLHPEQKQFFDDNGYLLIKGLYNPVEIEEMRREFHDLITRTENRPRNMHYSFMPPPEGYEPDPFNPNNVVGMMDQTLGGDYWFDQFTDPRVVRVMVDLLGPNIDFHNGKIRNKPPGFVCTQGWHQDWPYERHTRPDLAAAITYLDPHGLRSRRHRGPARQPPERRVAHPGRWPHHCRGLRPRRPGRGPVRRTWRCGRHPRPGRPPRRTQRHRTRPARHYQRVQNRGSH